MTPPGLQLRRTALLLFACAFLRVHAPAQMCAPLQPADQPAALPSAARTDPSPDRALPDIVSLMRDVESNERKAESIEKDYIYRSVETEQEFDSHGRVKKTEVTEADHFWVNGVPVRRIVKKDGKELSPQEVAKENERIDKLSAKASEKREKADEEGKETDAAGNEEITVSRLLELGSFTNPRRVELNGRDTIAVDFTGDPKAKTRNRTEEVIRDLAGTAWIDEQDRVLVRVEGHFVDNFRIGAGLIANVQKDTQFSMVQTKVNDEVWLPARFEGCGAFHALFFFGFSGTGQIVNSDYRKFRATAQILPGVTPVNPSQTNSAVSPQ